MKEHLSTVRTDEVGEVARRRARDLWSGELEARDRDRCIRSLGPGEIFGESGFLLNHLRTADVFVTAANTRLLSLSDRSLRSFITEHSNAGIDVLTNLARILSIRLGESGQLTG
jgi:CRP-like cAMP-binding protein